MERRGEIVNFGSCVVTMVRMVVAVAVVVHCVFILLILFFLGLLSSTASAVAVRTIVATTIYMRRTDRKLFFYSESISPNALLSFGRVH